MHFWMRWVNFRILRELLLLVAEFPEGLRPSALDRLGIERQILLSREGKPLGPSTRYHHRRILERFGLTTKVKGMYTLNSELAEVRVLIANKHFGIDLDTREKTSFANVVLRNKDCYEVFFKFFTDEKSVQNVNDFVEVAKPIELKLDHQSDSHKPTITIKRRGNSCETTFSGTDALQAIHFGLRSWCVGQLSFMDELYIAGTGYTIYTIDIAPRISLSELESKIFSLLSFRDNWATMRVGDIALDVGITFRVPIAFAKTVLERWLRDYPGLVSGIPTNERFIAGGLTMGQREAILKGFAREQNGSFLSHIRVHQELGNIINREETNHGKG